MPEKKEPTIVGGEQDFDYAASSMHNTSRKKSSAINP
jgi:hypothetical protein